MKPNRRVFTPENLPNIRYIVEQIKKGGIYSDSWNLDGEDHTTYGLDIGVFALTTEIKNIPKKLELLSDNKSSLTRIMNQLKIS